MSSRAKVGWGLGLLFVVVILSTPLWSPAFVQHVALPRVAARIGAEVTAQNVEVGFNHLTLKKFRIGTVENPVLTAPSVEVEGGFLAALIGRLTVNKVLVKSPVITAVMGGARDNVSAIREKLSSRSRRDGDGSGGHGLDVRAIAIEGAKVDVRKDDLIAFVASPVTISGAFDRNRSGTFKISLEQVELSGVFGTKLTMEALELAQTFDNGHRSGLPMAHVKNASATVLKGVALSGITGTLAPVADDRQRVQLDLKGSYAGSTRPLWNATGWLDVSHKRGELKVKAARFRLSQLEEVLRGPGVLSQVIDARDAEVDAHLNINFEYPMLSFGSAFHLSGLTISHPMLGPKAITNFGFDARTQGLANLQLHTLSLPNVTVDYRGVHAEIAANIENIGKKPRFSATLKIEPLPCQNVLAALPVEMTPKLQGFELKGTFFTDLHMGVDFGDLTQPIDLGGHVGIEGCKVLKAPAEVSAERLLSSFEQTVETEPGKWLTFFAGPENPDWVPYAEISPNVVNSITSTEDYNFFKHHGFIAAEFRSALQQNLQRGYFRLGASSITMQMVKNVLLSREKTLSRKLQELFLTWYIETALPKERIMEIYLNVIEFGPGIYGIGKASHHYFGKKASEIEPQEAAFFSSILPNPKRRYVQYCYASGHVDAKWDNYVKRILHRLHERGRIDTPAYEQAIAHPVTFDRTEAMPEKECMAYVKKITTPLPEGQTEPAPELPPEPETDNR